MTLDLILRVNAKIRGDAENLGQNATKDKAFNSKKKLFTDVK